MNRMLRVLSVAAVSLACDRASPSPASPAPAAAPVASAPAAAPVAPAPAVAPVAPAAPVAAAPVAPAAPVVAAPVAAAPVAPAAAAPAHAAPAHAAPAHAAPAPSAAPAGDEVRASKADNRKTVKAKVGQKIVLTLKATEGTEWKVVGVDRSFGYPEVQGDTFTWSTRGPFDLTGEHGVELELKDRANPEGPAKQKFSVTFVISE